MARHAKDRRPAVVVSPMAWVVSAVSLVIAALFDRRLGQIGRPDLGTFAPETWVLIAAILSALVVGSALSVRRPAHPVGWLFLALGVSMSAAGAIDGYAAYGAVARPGALRGARAAAHLGDLTFIPWLVIVAAVLHVTPTGRALTRRWGLVLRVTVVAGAVAFVSGLLSDRTLEPPYEDILNPLAIDALAPLLAPVGLVATMTVGLGLIAGGVSLLVRFHRSAGTDRQQLKWMYLAAAPLPLLVPAAFVSAWSGHSVALFVATSGFVVSVPVAAGLAIARYHLYEVERILSRAFTYVLLSALLVATYAIVVAAAGRSLAGLADSSAVAAVIATLVAVTIASPARGAIQNGLDRRFNRRRFDAVQLVEAWSREPGGVEVDEILRRAVGDPTLTIAYWSERRGQWSTARGTPVAPTTTAASVEVRREGSLIARLCFDPNVAERTLVESVCGVAAAELDNAGLRAAISAQLVEVNESRARIAAAETTERRRLERNLHDGAQQRLLALAMTLQAAQLNGTDGRLRDAVTDSVEQLQATIAELRDLANGLHPAMLSDGGIAAALDDLARRSPVNVEIDAIGARFDPEIEACAWFVACEAVTNAQKHSGALRITVHVSAANGWLDLAVEDDGRGGADGEGSGLQGIRDRAEAVGGSLDVCAGPLGGTQVRARLPCGS